MDNRRKEIFAGYKKAGIFWTLRKGAFMISPLIYVKVWYGRHTREADKEERKHGAGQGGGRRRPACAVLTAGLYRFSGAAAL